MKRHLLNLLLLTALAVSLSACRTFVPRLDYEALVRTLVRLGVDIGMEDNHKLYLEAAQWIGTPYRGSGETKRDVGCSGMICQTYKKMYHTKLQRSIDGQKKESSKAVRRSPWEGDLVFFSSRKPRRKVAHVGIYSKDRKFIHASTSQGAIVSSLNEPYYRTYWVLGGRVHKQTLLE